MRSVKKTIALCLFLVMLLGCLAPTANAANTQGAPEREAQNSEEIDWDEVADILLRVHYTGEPADVTDMRIPYNEENRSRIYRIQVFDPRFNVHYVMSDYCWIDGVKYYARFRTVPEETAAFRREYDGCMDAIETLTRGLKNNDAVSDVDKCLILHDRLCAWVSYDYDNMASREFAASSAFMEHYCVCQGYANAYNWLLRAVGIRAEYARSTTLGHGWSMVYLDGEPYYVDPTWDDPGRDTPGYIVHTHFMTSFETFSRNHRNATDFSDAPSSTIYESYFSKYLSTEVVYAGGDIYYLTTNSNNTGRLFKRTPGADTEVLSFPLNYTYTDEQGETKQWYYTPRITAVGDKILYTRPYEVRAYDTSTGEDYTVYTPSQDIFASPKHHLAGIRQRGGEVYVYANDTYHTNGLQPDHDTYMAQHSETFQFCDHTNLTLLKRLPGENCSAVGDGKYLCEDCGAIVLKSGEGVPGEHDFSIENVSSDTYRFPKTCASPAMYKYTCSVCGEIENNDEHLFPFGEADEHDFVSTVTPATHACPGFTENVCRSCSAVERRNFTFNENAESSGVLEEGFGWQIVDGVLGVTGIGALADFSAENRPPWYAYRADVTSAVVSGEVTAIGSYAFADMTAMETISLPGSVSSLGAFAFTNTDLTLIELPESLETIGASCFKGSASLGSVVNNSALRSIGDYAFENCASLTSLVIPGTVNSLGVGAINACSGLTTLTIEPGELYSLPQIAETPCRNLKKVYVPYTIETISSPPACAEYIVAPENESLASVDGVLFSKDLKQLLKYPVFKEGVYYHVPATTTAISGYAFTDVESLRFLDAGDAAVKTFIQVRFRSQAGDMHVNLPRALEKLDDMTLSFAYISKLFVPSSVRVDVRTNNRITVSLYTDSDSAPVKAYADMMEFPCTVLDGHVHSFSEYALSMGATCSESGGMIRVCECGQFELSDGLYEHVFSEKTVSDETLMTPATCTGKAKYCYSCVYCGLPERDGAHTFTSGDVLPHEYVEGEPVAATPSCPGYTPTVCSGCGRVIYSDFTFWPGAAASGSLTNDNWGWQLADGVLGVVGEGDMPDFSAYNRAPWYAYNNSIESLVLNGHVTRVGAYAFLWAHMTQAELPDSVASIGIWAFTNTFLTSISMPRDLEIIDAYAFNSNSRLETLTLNDGLKEIHNSAFGFCDKLSEITIPGSVTRMGSSILYNCTGLRRFVVEEGDLILLRNPAEGSTAEIMLEDFVVPSNVQTVSSFPRAERYTVSPDNAVYATADGVVYSKRMTGAYAYPAGRDRVIYKAPSSLKEIKNSSFILNPVHLRFIDLSETAIKNLSSGIRDDSGELRINLPENLTTLYLNSTVYSNPQKLFVPSTVTKLYTQGLEDRITTHIYTDSADAPVKAFCDEKGITCTVLEGHVHSFTETAYTETTGCGGGLVIKVCECGQFRAEEIPGGHTPGEPVETVNRAATCSVRGEKTVTVKCVTCGETLSETTASIDLNPDNHADYGTAVVNAVNATCHSDGYTGDTVCSRCRDVLAQGETISKDTVAHAWDEGTVTLKPTCSTTGTRLFRCTVKSCGATMEKEVPIDPNAHVFKVTVIEPTCTDDGYTSHACTLCRYGYSDNETPALGHSYAIRVTPPTCTSGGITTYTCTRCRDSYTKNPTPPVDHVDENGDGKCDFGCGTVMEKPNGGNENKCPYCGQTHSGFFGSIVAFFHRIANFFKHLFRG